MEKKSEYQFDMVKMAEAANRKKAYRKKVPLELQKLIVREFKALVSPAYDNHSFEAILCLKSYKNFERAKLGE